MHRAHCIWVGIWAFEDYLHMWWLIKPVKKNRRSNYVQPVPNKVQLRRRDLRNGLLFTGSGFTFFWRQWGQFHYDDHFIMFVYDDQFHYEVSFDMMINSGVSTMSGLSWVVKHKSQLAEPAAALLVTRKQIGTNVRTKSRNTHIANQWWQW